LNVSFFRDVQFIVSLLALIVFFKLSHKMNIYVGNLSWGLKDQDLANLFAPFGEVSSAKIVTDKFTQRSKGFGFVEMANDEEAQAAIAQLNGTEVEGRSLVVNESRPKQEGGGGGGGGYKNAILAEVAAATTKAVAVVITKAAAGATTAVVAVVATTGIINH
jgi:RNA recognition motif-containing protein